MSPRPVGDRSPEEFMAELATLQQAMGRFQAAFPDRAEGWDTHRVVQVAWSEADGVEVVTVARDWERKVDAARLGAAVVEAFGAAMTARAEEADRALQRDQTWGDIQAGRPTRAAAPVVTDPVPEVAPTADVVTIAEDVLATVGRIEARGDTVATGDLGSAANGAVTVELEGGALRRVEVDARWAAGRSGLTVVGALQQAVADARRRPAAAEVDGDPAHLDDLLGQLRSVLKGYGDAAEEGQR